MSSKLSPWCKTVKIKLIERDMNVTDLANAIGMRRSYVSTIVNGRAYSKSAVKRISDFLEIEDSDQTTVSS